ncbi:MAG: hypothetical protein JO307_31710 [Bryobacterales bacterium]|nr:hypothetical protein [Bryobacterales bacterium]MBV9398918.1 hypothetical protein [Bryobacterales bacterium]
MMTKTEALLNLLWVLVCVGALGFNFWRSRVSPGMQTRGARLRRTLSVFLAAVALFPCISASDDRVRLGDLQNAAPSSAAFDKAHLQSTLAPILEDPDHGLTCAPLRLAVVVSFFVMVRPQTPGLARWSSLSSLGRAPPMRLA